MTKKKTSVAAKSDAVELDFTMHPKLLYDVIKRQAGTLAKAVLEGVMNSVDAKATKCEITLTDERLAIKDDGAGITKREHIDKYFRTFGQPHSEEEHKKYGTFRMGRGQMFAFGVNFWQTGQFFMRIDFQKDGTKFMLETIQVPTKGCEVVIALYEQLTQYDLAQTIRTLQSWLKWVQLPVFLNGKQISNDPADDTWSEQNDDAYFSFTQAGTLSIYNMGVHTLDLPASRFGIGGTIVTKNRVEVNFARNDIQSTCEIWQRIQKVVKVRAGRVVAKKRAMTDAEREAYVHRVLDGEEELDETKRIITAVTGQHYSVKDFAMCRHKAVTVTGKGSRIGDTMHRQTAAFVIAQETLDRFDAQSVEHLIKLLRGRLDTDSYLRRKLLDLKIVSFESLADSIDNKLFIVPQDKWTPIGKLWMKILNDASWRLCENGYEDKRRILIGEADSANGWTDGATYIAINKRYLTGNIYTLAHFTAIGNLLLHEYCHDEPDLQDHDHDQTFYERFHDRIDKVGYFVQYLVERLPKVIAAHQKVMNKEQAKMLDTIAKSGSAIATGHSLAPPEPELEPQLQ